MPRIAVVKKSYPKKKPALLVPFILTVVKMMTDNAYFLKPTVVLSVLAQAATDLQAAYMNRKLGLNAKKILADALANAVSLLDSQASYVSDIAKGNEVIITSANFEPTKTTNTPSAPPQTPKPPVLENVNGALSISTDTVSSATSYCWIIFTGEPFPLVIIDNQINFNMLANIIVIPDGTSRELVKGLTRKTEVTVQVIAQNAAGKSAPSGATSIGIA